MPHPSQPHPHIFLIFIMACDLYYCRLQSGSAMSVEKVSVQIWLSDQSSDTPQCIQCIRRCSRTSLWLSAIVILEAAKKYEPLWRPTLGSCEGFGSRPKVSRLQSVLTASSNVRVSCVVTSHAIFVERSFSVALSLWNGGFSSPPPLSLS